MSKILVTTQIPPPGMDILAAAGDVEVLDLDPTGLAERCASGKYSVVVSQLRDRFDTELLAAAKLTAK